MTFKSLLIYSSLLHPFYFLTIYLLKNLGCLTYRVSLHLYFPDYTFTV